LELGGRDRAKDSQRLRPERGAESPLESERGWGPASIEKCRHKVDGQGLGFQFRRSVRGDAGASSVTALMRNRPSAATS
jgi:hypothetical protein